MNIDRPAILPLSRAGQEPWRIATLLAVALFSSIALTKAQLPASRFESFGYSSTQLAIHAVTPIPLRGPASLAEAQLSGLAWYRDWLILLPQYPGRIRVDGVNSGVFALHVDDLRGYLDGNHREALSPLFIRFDTNEIRRRIQGYEGFEAIAFSGQRAFLTIEARTRRGMVAYVISADIRDDLSRLTLRQDLSDAIPSQSGIFNLSDEAVLIFGEQILTIHEANGRGVTPKPLAHRFDWALAQKPPARMVNVPFRLTDVTAPDEDGQFWAANLWWPGDILLATDWDNVIRVPGDGRRRWPREPWVERLIPFRLVSDRIELTREEPIRLDRTREGHRNWEGIARWPDGGFLLASDKYPSTMLGYVSDRP